MVLPFPKDRTVRVLLVEDNLGDAALTLEAFKESKTPVEIIRVQDGDAAIAYLKKKNPYLGAFPADLVLLDLNMPKKNGLEVLEEIRKDPQLKEIPVLILTCSQSDADKRRAYDADANFYMVKPADLDEFFEAIQYVEEFWLSRLGFQNPSQAG
jgi:chemotaxis family two-component system response regulator Rcp1